MSPARLSRRLIFAATSGAVALSLAACGGSDSSTPATVPANADVVVRALDGVVWDKDAYTATAENGEVTIYGVNDSGIAHNLYVQTADGTAIGDFIDLPARGSDGTKTWKLEPGEYRIVCLIPGHQNMDSPLTVS